MALQYTKDKQRVEMLEAHLALLSDVYDEVMNQSNYIQPRADFFGARDFYSVVRHFLCNLDQKINRINEWEQTIVYLLRNFGGIIEDRIHGTHLKAPGSSLYDIMVKHLALNADKRDLKEVICRYSPSKLVKLNLEDRRSTHNKVHALSSDNYIISRHIMVITEHTNSRNVLMDLDVIDRDTVVIFGSEFKRDSSNMYLYLNQVQNCMETGQTLVLVNLQDI
eukprot:152898_1